MTFVRVMAFSLFVLLIYTAFANILPQVQSDPPAEEEVPTGAMDMAGLIGYGEKLFSGKGSCTLCHNDLGRAPDLLKLNLAEVFPQRLADDRYQGTARSQEGSKAIEAYVRESLMDPSAYVVAGFGKKGTDDKVSPMPKADKAPLELSEVQINALVAFLQDKSGVEPSVPLPSDADAAPAKDTQPSDDAEEEGPATTAAAVVEKFGCSACHDLEGSEADAGPKLNGLAGRMSRGKIIDAIIDPNAEIAEGFEADMMPADFGEQMRVSELNLMVDYLAQLAP
jgi:mono/diheme cytochrome c family protein